MAIDPRAFSPDPIAAPAPLPFVSRKALKRVDNPLPAPTVCRYCSGQVSLVSNSVIYKGRSYGNWPYAYLCSGCWAFVGLHPETDIPLGTLANNALRSSRNRSKAAFHDYMSKTGMSRAQAYRWLAEQMHVELGECHFGWFEQAQCELAESIVKSAKPVTAMSMAFAKAR